MASATTTVAKKRKRQPPRYEHPFVIQAWKPLVYPWTAGTTVFLRNKQRRGELFLDHEQISDEEKGNDKSVNDDDSKGGNNSNQKAWKMRRKDGKVEAVDLSKAIPAELTLTSTTQASPSSSPVCQIFVVADTASYRQWAKASTTDNDRVLEIGCSTGQTSMFFWKRPAQSWVGLDNSKSMVDTTNQKLQSFLSVVSDKNPSASTAIQETACCQVDALQQSEEAKGLSTQFGTPSLIFVDIGGNREWEGVVRMLDWVLLEIQTIAKNDSASCRAIIVKSAALERLLQNQEDQQSLLLKTSSTASAAWLQDRVEMANQICLPRHPLQAPLVYNPSNPQQPICRYYNYGACHRGAACERDHKHCHLCRQPDHIAVQCPMIVGRDAGAAATKASE